MFEEKLFEDELNEIKIKQNEVLDYVSFKKHIKPQLIWYDLNPENIIINNHKLSAIIDPGGAKYSVKELDLAFLKMEVCKSEEEFQSLLQEYKKLDNSVDEKLINAMCILVELDDIMLRLQERIYIPIPYCSNFKNIINRIQK